MSDGKDMIIHSIVGLIKKILYKTSQYFPKPYKPFGGDINDINKINAPKECDICHCWYFKDIGFKYEPYLYNGCHDLMEKVINFNDFAIVSVKGSDYRIFFGI